MEEKNFNFNEVTVRIHNTATANKFAETFKMCANKFASSKSAFIGYLAELGLETFLKEAGGKGDEPEKLDDYEKISEMIDSLIIYLRHEGECNSKRLAEILSLTSIVFPLVVALIDGEEVDKEEVLRGKYGDIPADVKSKMKP